MAHATAVEAAAPAVWFPLLSFGFV